MADYSDIKSDVTTYWETACTALTNIIRELDRGTPVDSKRLDSYYEDLRPVNPGEFRCSFCDRTKQSYNLVQGSTFSNTFEDMCVAEKCPALQSCRYDPIKHRCLTCIATIWYLKEGLYFDSEYQRHYRCSVACYNYEPCEEAAPTDIVDFKPLSEEAKKIKLKECLYELYCLAIESGWADTVISSWGV